VLIVNNDEPSPTINRQLTLAVIASVLLNLSLLMLSSGIDPRKPPTAISRFCDIALLPGSTLARLMVGEGDSGAQILLLLLSSILFYALAFWAVFGIFMRHRRELPTRPGR
jgi:hypothetical protein